MNKKMISYLVGALIAALSLNIFIYYIYPLPRVSLHAAGQVESQWSSHSTDAAYIKAQWPSPLRVPRREVLVWMNKITNDRLKEISEKYGWPKDNSIMNIRLLVTGCPRVVN